MSSLPLCWHLVWCTGGRTDDHADGSNSSPSVRSFHARAEQVLEHAAIIVGSGLRYGSFAGQFACCGVVRQSARIALQEGLIAFEPGKCWSPAGTFSSDFLSSPRINITTPKAKAKNKMPPWRWRLPLRKDGST